MIRVLSMFLCALLSLSVSARTLEDTGLSVEDYNNARATSRTPQRKLIEYFRSMVSGKNQAGYVVEDVLTDDPLQDELRKGYSTKYPDLHASMTKCAGNVNNPIMLKASRKLIEVLKDTPTYDLIQKMADEQGLVLEIGFEKFELISCPEGKRFLFLFGWKLAPKTKCQQVDNVEKTSL